MKINPVSFTKKIVIKIKDKSPYPAWSSKTPTRFAIVRKIADDNNVNFLVGEDIILISPNDKIIQDLKDSNIMFSVENDNTNGTENTDG